MYPKTKEEIIHGMCMTQRHDYGLEQDINHPLNGGMSQNEREVLYSEMEQLYDHYIDPLIKILDKTLYELPVRNINEHTFESIPDRVQYYVTEYAKAVNQLEKFVYIHQPYCKTFSKNLTNYYGWHCEC